MHRLLGIAWSELAADLWVVDRRAERAGDAEHDVEHGAKARSARLRRLRGS